MARLLSQNPLVVCGTRHIADAGRVRRGQQILRGRDAPTEGKAYATCGGVLVAVGDVERGELVPHRVFHLGGTAPRRFQLRLADTE